MQAAKRAREADANDSDAPIAPSTANHAGVQLPQTDASLNGGHVDPVVEQTKPLAAQPPSRMNIPAAAAAATPHALPHAEAPVTAPPAQRRRRNAAGGGAAANAAAKNE